MKKILIIFLFLFLSNGVKAYTGDTMVIKNDVSSIYYYYNDNGKVYSENISKIFANGNMVYRLDVKLGVNTTSYSSESIEYIDEDILLIAYFGYGYLNNSNLDYYLAAQQMIWEKLGYDVKFYTSINAGGSLISYDKYKDEISKNINRYKQGIIIEENMNYILGSKNNIKTESLKNYKIINNSENNIIIDENGISIEANKEGLYSFSLLREYKNNGYNSLFVSKNSSSLLYVGNLEISEHFFNYEVYPGILSIVNENTLESICYKNKNYSFILYDDSKNIVRKFDSLFINNKIEIYDLKEGVYILQRFLNNNYLDEYNFFINNDIKDEIIILKDDIEKTKIKLYTSYKNTKAGINIKSSDYIKIMDENNNVLEEIKTDTEGVGYIYLNCGKYRIAKFDGENNIDNYYLGEADFIEGKEIDYNTIYQKTRLRLYIYNKDNKLLKNKTVVLNGEEYSTNFSGYIETDYLSVGTYTLYIDNKEYEIILDDNSLFYLQNDNTYLDKNIYIEDTIKDEKGTSKDLEIKKDNVLPNLYESFNKFHI